MPVLQSIQWGVSMYELRDNLETLLRRLSDVMVRL